MTLPQLKTHLANIKAGRIAMKKALANLEKMETGISTVINNTNPLAPVPNQTQVDSIETAFTPTYTSIKSALTSGYGLLP